MRRSSDVYAGKCPICGTMNASVLQSGDGKWRMVCYTPTCAAWLRACPPEGFEELEDAKKPMQCAAIWQKTIREYIGR